MKKCRVEGCGINTLPVLLAPPKRTTLSRISSTVTTDLANEDDYPSCGLPRDGTSNEDAVPVETGWGTSSLSRQSSVFADGRQLEEG